MLRIGRAVGKGHLLGVAVIGRDEDAAADGERRVDNLADRGVGHLHGGERGREVAGVPDHVGVREVHDREVVCPAADRTYERRGHPGGAHLWLQVVCRDLLGRHQLAVLSGKRLLAAPVEEVGHVCVLLGLRRMELAEPGVGEELRHRHDLSR